MYSKSSPERNVAELKRIRGTKTATFSADSTKFAAKKTPSLGGVAPTGKKRFRKIRRVEGVLKGRSRREFQN